jgi:hypothetical protein
MKQLLNQAANKYERQIENERDIQSMIKLKLENPTLSNKDVSQLMQNKGKKDPSFLKAD